MFFVGVYYYYFILFLLLCVVVLVVEYFIIIIMPTIKNSFLLPNKAQLCQKKKYTFFARCPPNTKEMEDNARTLLLLLDKYFHHQYAGVFFALLAATFLSYRMFLGPSWTKKKRFQTNTPMGESCLCAIVSGCSSGIGLATVRQLLAKTN